MSRDHMYLLDILEAAKLALCYVSGKTKQDFLASIQFQDSVIRRVEIIGEAARHLSQQTRAELSHLPWSDMIQMRNVMIHEYDGIDLTIVWDTVQSDLPALVAALEGIVPPDEEA